MTSEPIFMLCSKYVGVHSDFSGTKLCCVTSFIAVYNAETTAHHVPGFCN